MILALSLAAVVGFTVPYALRLRRAAPLTAAVIWTAAVSLRALSVMLAVAWLLLFFPATHLFATLTHWCWHHLTSAALNGHDVGHATTVAPVLLGVASLMSVAVATTKLGRALRRHLAGSQSGGPGGSVVVGGPEVVVAVVGLRRPRVVVSAGALLELDDDELAAALAHERAHIRRRHRFIIAYAELCGAMARFVPGTRSALDELAFHLERDADRAALAGHADRRALAGALRKAAPAAGHASRLMVALGGSRLEERVREILEDPRPRADRTAHVCTATAAVLVALLLAVAASTPPALAEADHTTSAAHDVVDCDKPHSHRQRLSHSHS